MTDEEKAKLEATAKADATAGWAWLKLHPLVLGVIIGVICGMAAGAFIFGK